jgi:hypothetical protein
MRTTCTGFAHETAQAELGDTEEVVEGEVVDPPAPTAERGPRYSAPALSNPVPPPLRGGNGGGNPHAVDDGRLHGRSRGSPRVRFTA